jgi:hypothetical protein
MSMPKVKKQHILSIMPILKESPTGTTEESVDFSPPLVQNSKSDEGIFGNPGYPQAG